MDAKAFASALNLPAAAAAAFGLHLAAASRAELNAANLAAAASVANVGRLSPLSIPIDYTPETAEARLIDYRGEKIAAFDIDEDVMICLPQAYELFLKHLVGGLHTVYTKLKRLDIVPRVCNVEQVRALRSLGAIQPGVNRCKLISCTDFDTLFKDCTSASSRPGRPPKRSPIPFASPIVSPVSGQSLLSGVHSASSGSTAAMLNNGVGGGRSQSKKMKLMHQSTSAADNSFAGSTSTSAAAMPFPDLNNRSPTSILPGLFGSQLGSNLFPFFPLTPQQLMMSAHVSQFMNSNAALAKQLSDAGFSAEAIGAAAAAAAAAQSEGLANEDEEDEEEEEELDPKDEHSDEDDENRTFVHQQIKQHVSQMPIASCSTAKRNVAQDSMMLTALNLTNKEAKSQQSSAVRREHCDPKERKSLNGFHKHAAAPNAHHAVAQNGGHTKTEAANESDDELDFDNDTASNAESGDFEEDSKRDLFNHQARLLQQQVNQHFGSLAQQASSTKASTSLATAANNSSNSTTAANNNNNNYSSLESLLLNLMGLLEVTIATARVQDQQIKKDNAALTKLYEQERNLRQKSESMIIQEQRLKGLYLKRWKRTQKLKLALEKKLQLEQQQMQQQQSAAASECARKSGPKPANADGGEHPTISALPSHEQSVQTEESSPVKAETI